MYMSLVSKAHVVLHKQRIILIINCQLNLATESKLDNIQIRPDPNTHTSLLCEILYGNI